MRIAAATTGSPLSTNPDRMSRTSLMIRRDDAGRAVAVEPGDPEEPDAAALAMVVPPALATPGVFGPPPQAVAISATAASPVVAAPARRLRSRLPVHPLGVAVVVDGPSCGAIAVHQEQL